MNELLAVIDEGEVLREVIALVFEDVDDFMAGIKLQFSKTVLYLVVSPDDDTLAVSASAPPDLVEGKSLLSQYPWTRARGWSILWAWRLTNHQGYHDGIQLEFNEQGKLADKVAIQLVGMASMIDLSVVEAVHMKF